MDFFLFLDSRISEKQMWEPFCLPETLKYFSLRERSIVWAVCSGVSSLSALSHAETGQFSGSGHSAPLSTFWPAWCLSSMKCLQNFPASKASYLAFPPLIFQSRSPHKGFCLVTLKSWEILIFGSFSTWFQCIREYSCPLYFSNCKSARVQEEGSLEKTVSTLSESLLKTLTEKAEKGLSKWKAIPYLWSK